MVRQNEYTFKSDSDDAVSFAAKIASLIASLKGEWVIKVEPYKEKRSLNANSYMWVLCDKIAQAMSKDGAECYSKIDIYQNAIREVGVYKDYPYPADELKTLAVGWSNQGVGWFTDELDEGYRFYYGSSSYSKKRMARLIDYIVADAKSLGIETMTPDEIARLEAEWQ